MPPELGPQELFTRYPGNPILSSADWPYPAHTVFNPGATLLPDGQTLLLVRVEDRRGISHLTAARSMDGFTQWQIDPAPTLAPDPQRHPHETWGVEDPRIVRVKEIDRYVITYTASSQVGPCVAMAMTRDFVRFERRGIVLPPENKDAAIFPRRIGGRWAMIHRPHAAGRGDMWICYSDDMVHWGDHAPLLAARSGAWWDSCKIGLSPPPIRTDHGWLVLYHGVRMTCAGCLYRMGAALLDLDDPTKIIRRGDEWLFGPEAEYERFGDVGYVVFPCGATCDETTGELRIYYGAADTCVAVATARLADIVAYLTA
ncbi:MAG: glycosidase [Phycisphaerales bacterium]|nr:glycosidase [Phycisphaerales bacterium]